jgi:hypothetical protein
MGTLVFFIPHHDSASLRFSPWTDYNPDYICPKSSKSIAPETSLSPFQVGSDSGNDEKEEEILIIVPLSVRLFRKLEMTVLPSREVCILGEKLNNIFVPRDSEFQTMIGIAVWFSPCISKRTYERQTHCFEDKLERIASVDVKTFRTFYEFIVRAVYDKY